jgi:ABC-type transport system involved in cytochrome c biogenesis permease subunit
MTLLVLWRRLKKATSKALGVYFALFVMASLFAYFFFDSYNTKTLVPALQSPWFAPHVFVYIFAYTLLGAAAVMAIYQLLPPRSALSLGSSKNLGGIDDLVYVHYRQILRHHERLALWMLIGSFLLLQMCWWGINYLPSAQGSSVHTYSTN